MVLIRGDTEIARWALAETATDLSLVDQLARLQLTAQRMGCWIRLDEAPRPLCELVDLVGLTEVLRPGWGLVVQVCGETEGGEQMSGVEEAVEPGDPVA